MAAKLGSYVKLGFGLGIGSILATLIFLAVGMGLFLGGYVMYKKAKNSAHPQKTNMIIGIVLMALGCLIALGFGAPFLIDSIGDLVE